MTDASEEEFDQELEQISKRSRHKERVGLALILMVLALVAGGMLLMMYKNWNPLPSEGTKMAGSQKHAEELTESRNEGDEIPENHSAADSTARTDPAPHSDDTDAPEHESAEDSPMLGPEREPPILGPEPPPAEPIDNLADNVPQKSMNMRPKPIAKSLCSRATATLMRGKSGSFDRAYVYANGADWVIEGVNFNDSDVCEVAGAIIPDPCFKGAPGKHKASSDCPPRERLY